MLVGAVMTNIMVFFVKGNDVMFTAYPPLKAHPAFYLGIVLFAVGALLTLFQFIAALVITKKEGYYEGSLPLFTYGILIAVIIGIWTLLSGAIAYVPALLWSIGLIPHIDPEFYRIAFWGFGHSAQQINLAAMVAIWYLLALLTTGAKPINQKYSRLAFVLYLLGINLGSIHHILVDPTLGSAYRIFNTSYLFYAATIGSLIHAVSIPAAIERAQRAKGLTKGKFEWLTKAPWGNPGFSGLVISFVIFGFVGGVTGVLMSVEQLNLLHHNNLRVPGHFHATVVAGTTLAFMSIAYYVIPLVLQRKLIGETIAKFQPWIFGLGVLIFSTGMTFAGILGVPRRHFDISFTNAIFQVDSMSSGLVNGMMALVGLGAIVAVTGLFMFIIVAVLSVFFGQKVPTKMEKHTPQYPAAN
jgi:cytochrome c oxidase subunit 1